jgi:hypothetical protein
LVGRNDDEATWVVSKRDGLISLVTAGAGDVFDGEREPLEVSAGGAVVAHSGTLDAGDGYTYSIDAYWFVRTPTTGGSSEALFPIEEASTFIPFDGAYFGVTREGLLSYVPLATEPTEPTPIEQRGAFDDEDYPATMGLDEDAIYWFAGSDSTLRTSDDDPLALFRTCRPSQ